ncbi:MAG: anti-sigma factor [Pseudomonadota bacterium]
MTGPGSTGRGGGGRDDDRALIAEYALGLLTPVEAAEVEARMVLDPSLREFYAEWCESLASLTDGPDVDPPKRAKSRIDQRLFDSVSRGEQLVRWLLGAIVGAGAAAAVALVSFVYVIPALNQTVLEASLEGDVGVRLTARYESRTAELSAARLDGAPGQDRDHELWLILPGEAPVSLGLLDSEGRLVADLSIVPPAALAGAVLAVSDEPAGGSTTGAPTGDVLAAGPLQII